MLFLQVYSDTISNEGLIGIYCGSSLPPTISTRSNIMYIQIYSKVGLADVRFSANCMALCGSFLSASSGSFSSIDSDNDGYFDSFQNCTWFITAGDNQVIRLEIEEMDIEAFNDDLCSSVEITNTFKVWYQTV